MKIEKSRYVVLAVVKEEDSGLGLWIMKVEEKIFMEVFSHNES